LGLAECLPNQSLAAITVNRARECFPCGNNPQPSDGKIIMGIDAHDIQAAGKSPAMRKHRLEFMALTQALHAWFSRRGAGLPASGRD